MKRSIRLVAAGLLMAGSLGAYAQTQDFGLRADRGFYIAAGAGMSRANGQDCIGLCDVNDRSWNVSAGWQFNRNFAAEIGYADLGKHTVTVALVSAGSVTVTTEAKAVELLGVATLPMTEKFAFYLKGGLYRSDSKSTSPGLGAGIGGGNGNETGFTFGAGAQWSFTPNFAARFEWQNYNDVGTGAIGVPAADYTVWRLGARYNFF